MEKEIERLKALLPTINPISRDYETVLTNLRDLYWLNKDMANIIPVIIPDEPEEEVAIPDPTPIPESVPEPVVEQPKAVTATTLDKATVRAMLSAAAKNGTQIQPIIEKYVPEGKDLKFSEIPQDRYPELVKELNDAR